MLTKWKYQVKSNSDKQFWHNEPLTITKRKDTYYNHITMARKPSVPISDDSATISTYSISCTARTHQEPISIYHHSSASDIRSKYLHRLNVHFPQPPLHEKRNLQNSSSRQSYNGKLRIGPEQFATSSAPVKPQKVKGAREPTVCFHPSVNVIEIASHRSYSNRIRKTVWLLRSEFAESVTRNSLEFLSEGWNPDHVLEEKDFIFDPRPGYESYVHPAWLTPEYELMMAPYQNSHDEPQTDAANSFWVNTRLHRSRQTY